MKLATKNGLLVKRGNEFVKSNYRKLSNAELFLHADYGLSLSGNKVTQWDSKKPFSRYADQGTEINQPTYQNGAVNFDPSSNDQYLDIQTPADFSTKDEVYIAILFRTTDGSLATNGIIGFTNSSTYDFFWMFLYDGRMYISTRDSSPDTRYLVWSHSVRVDDGNWHLWEFRTNSSGNFNYLDGVLFTPSYTYGNASTQQFTNNFGAISIAHVGGSPQNGSTPNPFTGEIKMVYVSFDPTRIFNKLF